MALDPQGFETFLSQVSSRLRHDLKGGLITVRMGLESIDDDDIKPLLVEKLVELESLSDKLVKLLRMGSFRLTSIRTTAMMADLESWTSTHIPELQLEVLGLDLVPSWNCDVDAMLMALIELLDNARMAKAKGCRIEFSKAGDHICLEVSDDGVGLSTTGIDGQADLSELLCDLGYSQWESSGLGLAVVKQCVVGHGGTIELVASDDFKRLRTLLKFPEGRK